MTVNILYRSLTKQQRSEARVRFAKSPSVIESLDWADAEDAKDQTAILIELEAEARRLEEEETRRQILADIAEPLLEIWDDSMVNVFFTRVVVDDVGKGEEIEVTQSDGKKAKEMRYPKMYALSTEVNVIIRRADQKDSPKLGKAGKKRLVKQVYRKGTMPLALVVDGSKVDPALTTWRQCCLYLNENPALLNRLNGQPIAIIETTASGLVDLRTAGFIGIEA